jgi:hypothetical protein
MIKSNNEYDFCPEFELVSVVKYGMFSNRVIVRCMSQGTYRKVYINSIFIGENNLEIRDQDFVIGWLFLASVSNKCTSPFTINSLKNLEHYVE